VTQAIWGGVWGRGGGGGIVEVGAAILGKRTMSTAFLLSLPLGSYEHDQA